MSGVTKSLHPFFGALGAVVPLPERLSGPFPPSSIMLKRIDETLLVVVKGANDTNGLRIVVALDDFMKALNAAIKSTGAVEVTVQ